MQLAAMIAGVARAATFGAILVIGGAGAVRWLLFRGANDLDQRVRPRLERDAARIGASAAIVLLPALALAFAAQLNAFRDPLEPMASEASILLGTTWGRAWLAQCGLALLALILFACAQRWSRAWIGAAVVATALACTPAFMGHAFGTETGAALAVVADAVHVLAGATWLGGLFVLSAALAAEHQRAPGQLGRTALALLIRFSPLALTCAAAIVATGVFATWLHFTALRDFWTTAYGRLLSLKLAFFLGVVAAGAFNWRRATPILARTGEASEIRSAMRVELLIGALLILVTAYFVASPLPGE